MDKATHGVVPPAPGGTSTTPARLWASAHRRLSPAGERPNSALPQQEGAESWYWLGTHGGAGVSTLSALISGGRDAERRWPSDPAGIGAVVLVCRTHASGLLRARQEVHRWASGDVTPGLLLAGVVAVADAPGRLPRPLTEGLRMLSGITPQVWQVPWLDHLRLSVSPPTGPLHPQVQNLASDLHRIRPSRREAS
ncbi:hypothetical protein NUM3379_35240 [Kineococcus sp. NUM-3379]